MAIDVDRHGSGGTLGGTHRLFRCVLVEPAGPTYDWKLATGNW
jgi:hypothetical protein